MNLQPRRDGHSKSGSAQLLQRIQLWPADHRILLDRLEGQRVLSATGPARRQRQRYAPRRRANPRRRAR
jgi:hypothetical protein